MSKRMLNQEGSEKTFVPTGIERDLENARVLLEDPPWCDSPQKYRKTAETIVRRILSFDPENRYAKTLLEKARAPVRNATPAPEVRPVPEIDTTPTEAFPSQDSVVPPFSQPKPARVEELSFSAYNSKPKVQKRRRRRPGNAWTGIAAVLVIAGVLGFRAVSTKSQGHSAPKTAAAATVPVPHTPSGR